MSPCRVTYSDNGVIIACGRPSTPKCSDCGKPAPYLCDYVIDDHGCTCDAAICSRHRIAFGWGRDYCLSHNPLKTAS